MKLYDIILQYRGLVDKFSEAETDEEADEILAELERVDATFEDKIEQLTKAWKNIESDIPGIEEEITRLTSIKTRAKRRVDKLKDLIKNAILVSGKPKVKTNIGTVRVQMNSQASVVYEGDAKELPTAYRNIIPVSYECDKKAVQDAFKQYEQQLEYDLTVNPELDRREHYINWLQSEGLPVNMVVERGKHVRLQ